MDVGEADAVFFGPEYSVSAAQVLLVGDMDGDGRSEIAIGDMGHTRTPPYELRGKVYLFYGERDVGSSGTLGEPDATLANASSGGVLSLAAPGDVDGDGYADLLVGMVGPRDCPDGGSGGQVLLVYGGAERLVGAHRVDRIGAELLEDPCLAAEEVFAGAGNLDGDAFDDFALTDVGHGSDGAIGRVHLYHGRRSRLTSGGLEGATTVLGSAEHGLFGAGLAPAGDVDGDGYDDFLIGFRPAEPDDGTVHLVYGDKEQRSGVFDVRDVRSVGLGPDAGHQPCTLGDLDDDGFADFGVVRSDELGSVIITKRRTLAYHRGSTEGLPVGAVPAATLRTESGRIFRCGLAGDLDADGDTEAYVSDPLYDDGRGILYIIPGGTVLSGEVDLAAVSVAWLGRAYEGASLAEGEEFGDLLGTSVSGGQDVNGDGYDDLIVGAHDGHSGDAPGGRAYLLLGGP